MKNSYLFTLLLSLIAEACNQPGKPSLQNQTQQTNDYSLIKTLSWMEGSWISSSPQGRAIEIWSVQNDSLYSGKSFFVAGTDTVSSETITIQQEGKQLYYIPVVKNQNGGKPVRFTLKSSENEEWVFENLQHDFPTRISYRRIGKDSLLAEISGMQNGREEKMQFAMKRQ